MAATGETEEALLRRADAYLPQIGRFAPDLVAEIEGIGRGSGLGFRRALFLQVATELSLEPLAGCSAIGRVTPGHEPLIAQNWDQPIESAGKQAIVRFEPTGKPHILMFGHAGVVGYIGLNDRGVGHVGNQLYSSAPPAAGSGLTQYVINRRLLEFERAEDALAWLTSVPVASTCNYVLGDASGTLVDVELGRGRAVVQARARRRRCTPTTTCDPDGADTDASADVLPDSPARLAALRSRPADLEALQDHTGHPVGVCRHEEPPGLTSRASIVLRLAEPATRRRRRAALRHALRPLPVLIAMSPAADPR